MYKKLISILLAFTLLTQIVGCYTYQEITKEEFRQAEEYLDLRVRTMNQDIYEFDENDYTVNEDSIYGSGKLLKIKREKRAYIDYTGSIYLEDIESFEFDRFNALITVLVIAVCVGGFVINQNSKHPFLGFKGK